MPVELNSVSDSSRRHSPTKRIASINAGWGGVTWACAGWSGAAELSKRGWVKMALEHFPPFRGLQKCRGFIVFVFFFPKAEVSRTVNETEVKQSWRDF